MLIFTNCFKKYTSNIFYIKYSTVIVICFPKDLIQIHVFFRNKNKIYASEFKIRIPIYFF